MFRKPCAAGIVAVGIILGGVLPGPSFAQSGAGPDIATVDHYVAHTSTAPAAAGEVVTLYLRERSQADLMQTQSSLAGRVVLFVHGSALGSTGAFDAPYQDYSWMAYLAQAGFDTFALDLTGFGFSTRPAPMDNPCNLSESDQTLLASSFMPANCQARYDHQVTTVPSGWDDLDAAIEYLRALRHVDRVSLLGWSAGGTTAGGYATVHPEKVDRLVFLSPSYDAAHPDAAVPETPAEAQPMFLQPRGGVPAFWDPQVKCSDQVDLGIRDALWNEGLVADGVSWAPGFRRVPTFGTWSWNRSLAARVQSPTLIVEGEFDHMSPNTVPESIRAAYADLGTPHKVLVNLACSSHFAMWETRHLTMFQASLEWLRDGSVNGMTEGEVRLGD